MTAEHHITLNGQARSLGPDTTVANLLESLELPAGPMAVEVNARIVPRSNHASTVLENNDRVEIVTMVGGG